MQPYLNFGVFKRLKDTLAFQQVRVSFDTLEWQAGIGSDPEFVYKKQIRLSLNETLWRRLKRHQCIKTADICNTDFV